MKALLSSLLGSLLCIAAIGCAPRERYTRVAAEVQPKAVMIEVDTVVRQLTISIQDGNLVINQSTAPATFLGAGVLISPNGQILSCAHLFTHKPVNAVRVREADGSTVPAKVLYYDVEKDLSLVKIDTMPTGGYAKLSKTSLRIGQEVIAVGNPLGLPFSVSHGIISAFRPEFDNGYNFTQIDAAINHGNSGGPLFNLSGELIGINTLKADDGEGLGFSVSPETIREFLSLFRGL